MNTYLKYQPPALQFMAFLGLATGFIVLNSLLMQYFFSDLTTVLLNKQATIAPEMVVQFKLAQTMSAVLSFLVPALLFGYFSSPKPVAYIGLQSSIGLPLIVLSMLVLVMVQPFAGWLGQLNQQIDFGSMQKAMQEAEAGYNRALQAFLKMDNATDVLINLFVMAMLPAIAEELFFRGGLQKVVLRMTKLPVLSIAISSLIFALLHGTIFKALPIFALGLMLGTIYHVTHNLWYNVIIHFLNNGLAVLAVYFADSNKLMKKLTSDDMGVAWYAGLLSLAATVAIIYFMYKKSKEVFPLRHTDEHNDYIA